MKTMIERFRKPTAVECVWKRQDEAKKMFIDHDTFAEVERLDIKVLTNIAKEEGTTLEKFLIYARQRSGGGQ